MIQQIITVLACMAIVAMTEPAINRMTRKTPISLRAGFWSLCVAAIAGVVNIALGAIPSSAAVFGTVGVALYLYAERRLHKRVYFHAQQEIRTQGSAVDRAHQ